MRNEFIYRRLRYLINMCLYLASKQQHASCKEDPSALAACGILNHFVAPHGYNFLELEMELRTQ